MARYRASTRGRLISTCILVLILCLLSFSVFIQSASAADPWPGSSSTEVGGNLPGDCEPSGLAWNPALNSLFLVSDNGKVYQLDTAGNISADWSPGGDLEGVALVEGRPSCVYLGIEHPDSIQEFNLSTGALTGHSWDLTPWMAGADNAGLEALTFVPDGYHPYSYDLSSSGGLFYAGLQADGKIYVFDVDLSVSGSVSHVATLTPEPGTSDIADLNFCEETNTLYAIYDSNNLMVEMRTDGTVLHEYALPGNDQEGVTVIPSSTGSGEVYVGEDVGPELWRYTPYPTPTVGLNNSPPSSPVKLTFIHHSCGSNWLSNSNGNLGTRLNDNDYYVTETDYGWDAEPGDNLGDRTDTVDWPSWFNATKMPYVYSNSYHSAYANIIADPGGENEIVMFKSCYPNSEVGGGIDDEKAIYNGLLPYFSAHTNKLFVLITPPGETNVSSYARTKELCDWLVDDATGWLAGYTGNNVMVFDFYGVLSETDSHHRMISGEIEHVYAPSYDGTSPYHDGDDHPNSQGNQKATAEFALLLNVRYHQWKDAAASIPTVQTNAANAITTSSANLNGNITERGEEICDQRGFDYRLQGAGSWQQTVETGSFGTGDFDRGASSLTPATTFEFRAKAHNSAGWGYGDIMTLTTGSNPPEPEPTTYYLAEGTTDWGFSTSITVTNPNSHVVNLDITYMPTDAQSRNERILVPPLSQTTLANDHLLTIVGKRDFSTRIVCADGYPMAVDRTMTWIGQGAPSPEGHSSIGVTEPSTTWYMPEGTSDWGFETWLLIQNPNGRPANCTITYMVEGGTPVVKTEVVPASSRKSYSMFDHAGKVDASIQVRSDKPVICERSVYRHNRREGHESIGTTAPAPAYYLAEGTTDWGFTTYVLIQNPNPRPVDVIVTYLTGQGEKPHPQNPVHMEASSRKTIRVNDFLPPSDFSTKVESTSSAPIIAERAMYWGEGTTSGEACHDSIGLSEPHTTFYLPDGQADSSYETWTLVANSNNKDVKVTVAYLTPTGKGNVTKVETIPANTRRTFNMARHSGLAGRASTVVTCTTFGKKIMVERAMYWHERGAGTDTVGGTGD